MRIIAGKFRGRNLKSPPTLATRPTSDRLRETLFNILAPKIAGARFLDLCAGSGAVGIEALSRGAAHTTFVDRSRKMYALIKTNLDLLKVSEDEAEIINREAEEVLRRLVKSDANDSVYDIVFFDPPYTNDYEEVLTLLAEHHERLLTVDGLVIVEHHRKKDVRDEFGVLRRVRLLKQGDSCLSFYQIS